MAFVSVSVSEEDEDRCNVPVLHIVRYVGSSWEFREYNNVMRVCVMHATDKVNGEISAARKLLSLMVCYCPVHKNDRYSSDEHTTFSTPHVVE